MKSKRRITVIATVMLIMMCFIMSSCADEDHKETDSRLLDYLNNKSIEGTVYVSGDIDSNLKLIKDLTSYKSEEEVDEFITAPCSYITGDSLYMIRNFPENMSEDIYEYIASADTIFEIEAYSLTDLSASPRIISLTGPENRKIIYYSLSCNETDGRFIIVGGETDGENVTLKTYVFDKQGQLLEEYDVSNVNSYDMIGTDGSIFYTTATTQSLYRYDYINEANLLIDDSVEAFSLSGGSLYYVKNEIDADYNEITGLYVCGNGETEKLFDVRSDIGILSISYDTDNALLYLSDGINIYTWNEGSGSLDKVIKGRDSYLNIKQIDGENMLIANGNNQLSLYALSSDISKIEEDEKRELKICYISSNSGEAKLTYDEVLKELDTLGFTTELNDGFISDSKDEYINTMAKKLLAKDSDFDLFYVDSDMLQLLKKDYYFDLSVYPLLSEKYARMYDGVKEISSIDGKLCLIPLAISFQAIEEDVALSDYSAEMPEIWGEFIEYSENVCRGFTSDKVKLFNASFPHNAVMPLFNQYASNFINGNSSADREALKELITQTGKLLELNDSYGNGSKAYFGYSTVFSSEEEKMTDGETKINKIPKISADFKIDSNVSFIAVNPNSKNVELAAAFAANVIDCYTSMGVVELYRNDDVNGLYNEMLSDCIRGYRSTDYTMLIAEQIESLTAGSASTDEITDTIYNFLKITRDE